MGCGCGSWRQYDAAVSFFYMKFVINQSVRANIVKVLSFRGDG